MWIVVRICIQPFLDKINKESNSQTFKVASAAARLEEAEPREGEDAVVLGQLLVVDLDDVDAGLVQGRLHGLKEVENAVARLAVLAV